MNPNAAPAQVILRDCPEYDPQRIRVIVREALDQFGLKPHGRTLVKPNLVSAGPLFQHAYTRPEVAEGVLLALKDRAEGLKELAVGERCGITIPTRYAMEHAGYDKMIKRLGVKKYHFEEETQVEIPLKHEGRLRDYVFTPEPVAKADFFVNLPKFKSHPWTTVTFSMKNYIGIQDDRHRLIDHDHRLNEKVADLQHVIQPRLIVIDGVIAGEGRMLTPIPRRMNLLVLGNNQPAIDAVCCHIIGVDPYEVEHIRLPHQRGFGPISLEKIQLSGDVTLDQAKERAKGFKVGLIRVEKYFEGSKITAYAGPPPEKEHTEYCWGGCPGAIEEAIEIIRLFDETADAKMPRLHVVFGDYRGKIDAKPGEKVIFIGDCAQWHGQLNGQQVDIASTYQPRETKDPHHISGQGLYQKMTTLTAELTATRKDPYIRLKGCPVSVAEQVLALVGLSPGVKNPYFDKREIVLFNKSFLAWRAAVAKRKLFRQKYQQHGPAERGDAAPEV